MAMNEMEQMMIQIWLGGLLASLKEGKVDHVINELEIALFSMYTGNSSAFDRNIDGQVLEFEFSDNKIIDLQTSSEWSYDGIAISGELEGVEMNRLPFNPGFWFEWVAFHPDTEVYVE